MLKVKLDDVLEAIELAFDEFEYFYNNETGEIILYGDPMLTGVDQSEFLEDLEENFDKYIRLPTKFEINDYHIMETFIWNLPEGRIQDELEIAIRGRGAFRRFKDKISYFDIEDQWFSYRDKEYKRMAIRWCKDNNIEYVE